MKKVLFFLLLTFCITKIQAKIKIQDNHTKINNSGIFELQSANVGLLLPILITSQMYVIKDC